MLHAVKIIQVYKATREITVFVDGDTFESAKERVASGDFETPPFYHPNWVTSWDLQNEEYEKENSEEAKKIIAAALR